MSGEAWGAFPKLIGQDVAVSQYGQLTGAGMSVAVIDTGVDYLHPALGGGMGSGYKVIAGYDFVGNDTNPMDTDGHGTGVAGMVAANAYVYNGAKYQGVAPGANIIALRVDDGTYSYSQEAPYLELALQWVIAHRDQYNIVAVNMSLGRGHYDTDTTVTRISDELATLAGMNVFMAASSGNDGVIYPLGVEYPSSEPSVYSIGSIAVNDSISTFTERGPLMDLLAPGENVPAIYYLPAENRHITLAASGTSFASPFAAGAAVLLKQIDPDLTPSEMIAILKQSGVSRYDSATGLTWPRIQLDAALRLAYQQVDDASEPNDIVAAATHLSFGGNTAAISGLESIIGNADFFSFDLESWADVDFSITHTGAASPSVDLLDSSGNLVRHLSASDSQRLANGRYFLRVNAPAASLDGSYGLRVDRTPDDALNNHSRTSATAIAISNNHGQIAGATLLANLDDYFTFNLSSRFDVDLAIDYAGPSTMPSAQLLDGSGNVIASFTAGALTQRLSAGTYYVRVSSTSNLSGNYGLSIDTTSLEVPGEHGSASSIAYDPSGNLHFAWYDEFTKNLKYALRSASGQWDDVQVIDGNFMAGQYVSLAIDAAGLPGMAYYDANNGDLKYAYYSGSVWDVETIDAKFTTGYYPSLKYDGANHAVITHYYKTGGDLRLATQSDAGWAISTIDSGGDVGRYSSLALNPLTGRWSVAYEDTARGTFKYADQTRSGWSTVTVDASTKIGGGYISLAFSPKTGRPGMSYYDAYNANLKYATFDGARWSSTTLASKGSVGLYSNLRITASGDADILYFSKTADAVFSARQAGSTWATSQLTSDGGRWINRALSPAGATSVLYLSSDGLKVFEV